MAITLCLQIIRVNAKHNACQESDRPSDVEMAFVKSILLASFTFAQDTWKSVEVDRMAAYMIFVTGTTGRTCGEKICHVEKFQISPHLSCGEI